MVTKQTFKEIQEIKTFQRFLSNQYEDIRKRLQESVRQIDEFQRENANLSEQLQHQTDQLTHQINLLDQCSRRDCLEFQGIAYKDGESTDNLVIQYAKQTGTTTSEKDISISHRLAPVDPISNKKVPTLLQTSQAAKSEIPSTKISLVFIGRKKCTLEMARAANGLVYGQAADNIFSHWISPSRQLMLKKPLKTF